LEEPTADLAAQECWIVRVDRTEKIWGNMHFGAPQIDFVYIPPYVTYQHFNADPDKSARIIMITSRIVKKMGFDWFEQVERAEGF